MIPAFDRRGNLPPGVHRATWRELHSRFGGNAHRQALLRGLRQALTSLRAAGCRLAYIDGSFVTNKVAPDDFDGCWEGSGVDPGKLDKVLLDFANKRAAQKAKFGGEFFIADSEADPAGTRFIEFFQQDRNGNLKGIIAIDLKDFK